MDQFALRKKIRLWATLSGILTALLMASLPVVRMFVSPEISVAILTAGSLLFVLAMALIVLGMLVNPQWFIKLAAIPVIYVLFMVGVIIHQLNVYTIFKIMLGAKVSGGEDILSASSTMGNFTGLSVMLHVGVFVTCIPLIIAAIVKSRKLSKRSRINFDKFDTVTGEIGMVKPTHMRINRVEVYQITVKVPYYAGESYETTREFAIPRHIIHTLTIGSQVNLKVNPDKKEEVYLLTEYGVL